MTIRIFFPPGGGGGFDHIFRYGLPHLWQISSEAIYNVEVHYVPIDIPIQQTIDGIGVFHGSVAAGNLYVALYDSVDESPVNRLAVSPNTPVNGVARKQLVPFSTPAQVDEGYHFLAFEPSDSVDTYFRGAAGSVVLAPAGIADGPSWYRENLGGYAQPPATATPVQSTDVILAPALFKRTSSVP